jgi:hypothetical protein
MTDGTRMSAESGHLTSVIPGQLTSGLTAVPNGHDPHGSSLGSIEEAVPPHQDFAVGEFGELGQDPTGAREALQSPKGNLRPSPEPRRGSGVVSPDER